MTDSKGMTTYYEYDSFGGIRAPDFIHATLSLNVFPEGLFMPSIVTWNISVSMDRYRTIHWSPFGFAVGKSWTKASLSVTANWLD